MMKLMKKKQYLQQTNSRKVRVSKTTKDSTLRVSKSHAPFYMYICVGSHRSENIFMFLVNSLKVSHFFLKVFTKN